MSMYTLVMHSNSFWPVQLTAMYKHAYLVEIFIFLLSGQFFGSTCSEKWQLSTLMLNLYGNCFSGIDFQSGSEG